MERDYSDDARLIREYLAGSPDAFPKLYERHREDLMNFCTQLTRDPAQAQDLFQDTWIRVLESLGDLREPQAFRKHLLQTAYHRAVDLWRKRGLRRFFSLDGSSEEESGLADRLTSPEPGPDLLLEEKEVQAGLYAALATLPGEQRAVVLLRLREELSFREIAEVTGAPLGTVLARMSRAVERLRRLLGKEAGRE